MCIYHNSQSIYQPLVRQAVQKQGKRLQHKGGSTLGNSRGEAPEKSPVLQPPSSHLQIIPPVPRKQRPHICIVAEIPKATHPLSPGLWIFKDVHRVETSFWVNTCSQGEMEQYITRQQGWEKHQSWPDTLFLENSSTIQTINLFCKSLHGEHYFEIVTLECILVYTHTQGLVFFSFKVYRFWPSYSPSINPS